MKKILLASLLSGLGLLSINTAFAANVTGNFQATSTLSSTCSISVQDITFGQINVITYVVPKQTGTINLLCSKGVAYSLTPEGGYNLAGSSYQGIFHILRGTGSNKDGLVVSLEKNSGGNWTRDNQGTTGPITGVSTGVNQTEIFKVDISDRGSIQSLDATLTNSENRFAKPDVYTGIITTKITY